MAGYRSPSARRAAADASGKPNPTLKPLGLEGTAKVGVASTIGIIQATPGSTITVQSGSLPAGMTLNSAARTITGTPQVAGSSTFTLRETLAGATNTPKDTAQTFVAVNVASVPASIDSVAAGAITWAGANGVNIGPVRSIAIGPSDSRGKNAYQAGYSRKSQQHPLIHALAALGQRARLVYNGGISGNRSDQYLQANSPDPDFAGVNNLDALLRRDARIVLWPGLAVNDFTAGYTAQNVWDGYNGSIGLRRAFEAVQAKGGRNLIYLESGAVGMAPTQPNALNGIIREWADSNPQTLLLDVPAIIWSPAATSTIAFKSGVSADGTHLLALGARMIGVDGAPGAPSLSALLSTIIPPVQRLLVSGLETSTLTGGRQIAPNPLFLTTTGGTLNAGMTGAAPSGVTVKRISGAPTATVSVIDDPNGFGKAVQVAATFGAAGDNIAVEVALPTTGLATGTKYTASGRVDVAAGSSNAAFPYAEIQMVNNGYTANVTRNDMYTAGAYGPGPTTAYSLGLETDALTLPAFSTVDEFRTRIHLTATAAGSATYTIAQLGTFRQP